MKRRPRCRQSRENDAGALAGVPPDDRFPPNTSVVVQIGPGTPSAEGPRKTDKSQSYSLFSTTRRSVAWQYCKKEVRGVSARVSARAVVQQPDRRGEVRPQDGHRRAGDPRREDRSVRQLPVDPRPHQGTKRKVTLASTIPDQFGQTLGKDETLTFHIGTAGKTLYSTAGEFVVLIHGGAAVLDLVDQPHQGEGEGVRGRP